MKSLYTAVCQECSELITKRYSTSFSLGIRMFHKEFRGPIYAIYGFTRFADEIVDTFFECDQKSTLEEFRQATFKSIEQRFSTNPVLHSFQEVVNKYQIDHALIEAFLYSMAMDLDQFEHTKDSYDKYIYGSAEVVGLMCLKVFVNGDQRSYKELTAMACSLGSAFQKVNFLRDLKSDFVERGRVYFPNVNFHNFDETQKVLIEQDIQKEFDFAYKGIIQLPKGVRFGVYTAYTYYLNLFQKIKDVPKDTIMEERVRIPNRKKIFLLTKSAIYNHLNLL